MVSIRPFCEGDDSNELLPTELQYVSLASFCKLHVHRPTFKKKDCFEHLRHWGQPLHLSTPQLIILHLDRPPTNAHSAKAAPEAELGRR